MSESENGAIVALFEELAAAFSALDLPRLRVLYEIPCMMVAPQAVAQIQNEDEFAAFFTPMMQRLHAAGFARSAFDRFSVHLLAPTLALASMRWTRHRTDGTALEQLGATYTLIQRDSAWRIVGLIGHAADASLTFGRSEIVR